MANTDRCQHSAVSIDWMKSSSLATGIAGPGALDDSRARSTTRQARRPEASNHGPDQLARPQPQRPGAGSTGKRSTHPIASQLGRPGQAQQGGPTYLASDTVLRRRP